MKWAGCLIWPTSLGLTVATVMQMSVAEYEGWIEWSKRRAEADE